MNDKLLLGELREFKRSTIQWQIKADKKLDALQSFRMRLIGAAALSTFVATFIVELLRN